MDHKWQKGGRKAVKVTKSWGKWQKKGQTVAKIGEKWQKK